MARLPFKTAFLFGVNAPSDSVAVFGSLAASAPAFSYPPDPAAIQALTQWGGGWTAPSGAVQGTNQPAIEDVMAKDYVDSYFINYFQQIGIVEWDASGNTPYDTYSVVNGGAVTGNFQIYMSRVDNNTAPLSDPASWRSLGAGLSGGGIAPAWAVFDGSSGTIKQAFNVSSVTRTSTGNYTANFASTLSSATPGMVGSCSGLVRPITPGANSFSFDTAGLSGGFFSPTDYPYVTVTFYSA